MVGTTGKEEDKGVEDKVEEKIEEKGRRRMACGRVGRVKGRNYG